MFKPKYAEISTQLYELIKEYDKKGKKLPTEREMSVFYSASRTTIRKALSILEEKKIVERISGKGYVILHNQINNVGVKSQMHINGFYADIMKQNKTLDTKVIERKIITADLSISRKLEIAVGDAVIYLVRLRSIEKKKYSITISYLPFNLCPEIMDTDLTNRSLWGFLRDNFNIHPIVKNQTVSVRNIKKEEASLLSHDEDTLVMVLNNLAYWNGHIIEDSFVITDVFSTILENKFVD